MPDFASSLSKMSSEMSIDQMELLQNYITKQVEFKKAEEAFLQAMGIEDEPPAHTTQALSDTRQILENLKIRLSGSEAVLLASYIKWLEGEEHQDTKRLNILLSSYQRKPSNTTKIVDTLTKKHFLETQSDGLHSHKTFQLTRTGEEHAAALLERLLGSSDKDHLALVR